jgi:DNA-binding response OmpR family regulator
MKHKLLIVDDDPQNLTAISSILDHPDNEIYIAYDGKSAIEIAQIEQPDLIILDWQMPGIDGLETLRKLKSHDLTNNILVIMITGIMTKDEHLLEAYETGAIDFITKPFNRVELMARTRSVLTLAQLYKNEIEQKDRELVSNAMKLVNCNQYNFDLFNKIKIIENSSHDEITQKANIKELRISLENRIRSDSWSQFEDLFVRVHPKFHYNLLQKHPKLTPSELKLSTLLRLNLSSKDIATILYLSPDSIRVSRTRLRKKLNLPEKENLTTYLISI